MPFAEALVLGLLQGLTEFLPVSGTAHLRIPPELVGWGDPGAAFTAITQLGVLSPSSRTSARTSGGSREHGRSTAS